MRSLADQRDAMSRELLGLLDRKRKQMASRLDTNTAEYGMRLCFRGFRQFVIAQRHQPFGFPGRGDPHHAGAVAGQGHKYARTLRGMKLGRDISMWSGMADVKGQGCLIEAASPDLDAGGLAAERLPTVG